MNDSRDFQDAESGRSGHSQVTSQPVSFPPHRVPGGMLRRSIGMPSRKDGPPSVRDTHGTSGNVFCKSSCVFFSTLSAGVESIEFSFCGANSLINGGGRMRIKHQFKIRDASPDRQPKIHSSLVREIFKSIKWETNKDCKSRNFTLTNSVTQQHLLVGSQDSRLRYVFVHNFLRKLCCGSKKWRCFIQWMIKNLRYLLEEFECQILKYSMRRLFQH